MYEVFTDAFSVDRIYYLFWDVWMSYVTSKVSVMNEYRI